MFLSPGQTRRLSAQGHYDLCPRVECFVAGVEIPTKNSTEKKMNTIINYVVALVRIRITSARRGGGVLNNGMKQFSYGSAGEVTI